MLGLVKIYIAMMVLTMVAVAAVGAFCIKRCGCRLYERVSVPAAERDSFWAVMLVSLLAIGINIAQPIFRVGADIAERWNWSPDYGMLIGIGLAFLLSAALGLLARFVFCMSKTIAVSILRKQQMHQREICRELQEQLAKVDFRHTACEDVLDLYINCRKEITSCCTQPAPVKCPVGIDRRRFGYVDEQDLAQLMEIWKDKLFQMSAEREDSKVVSIGEPEFFELDAKRKTSPATVMVTAPFVSYYEGEQKVHLSVKDAQELEAFLDNFTEQSSDTKSA